MSTINHDCARRRQDIRSINSLWGAPGEDWNTPEGEAMLLEAIREGGGLRALSDDVVARLADMHRAMDDRL